MQIVQSDEYRAWFAGLRDPRAITAVLGRLERLRLGNLGDVKSVGGGVSEMRIAYGPGFRLYFTRRSGDIILLLCAGDKGSQTRDIARARKMALERD